jgi:acetate kinase
MSTSHRGCARSPELAEKKVVVAHLGSGASLCAMQGGRSVDTTMGFTPLDGLVMGTRCGTVDPGILLYLQRERGMSAPDLEQMLYHQSGLAGVSGIVDLFAFEAAKAICAMALALEGLNGLVFTGGIGEHAAQVRALICQRLRWLGLDLDSDANDKGAGLISHPSSSAQIRMIPTSEETTMARQIRAVVC